MKTAFATLAAALALAPGALAQSRDHVVQSRAAIVARQIDHQVQERERQRQLERERQQQERARIQQERERQRAEQMRRQYPSEQTDRSTRTLRIGGSGEITLSNLSGDIIVTRGGGRDAQVEIVKTARGRTDDETKEALAAVTVDVNERGSRAEIRTVYPTREDRGRNRNFNVSVQYTVTAPENTRISASSLSGSLRVRDIKGDLNLTTLSGNVVIENGARVLTAKSTSGNVEITNLRSETALEANTMSGNLLIRQSSAPRIQIGSLSGNVAIESVNCGRLEAETMSGTVTFDSPLERNGRYELSSHSGVIRLTPSGNVGFELNVDSFSGNIDSALSLKDERRGSGERGRRTSGRVRSLSGTYGDGSAAIDITTFSGTVILGKR